MSGATGATLEVRFASERLVIWASLALLLFIVGTMGLLRVTNERNAPVITVLLVLTGLTVAFELFLVRNGAAPFFEVGGFLAGVCWLYSGYPLLAYLANGMAFTTVNDNRLWVAQPSPAEMATIGWMYVVFLAAFCGVYALVRGRRTARFRTVPGDERAVIVAVCMAAALQAFIAIVKSAYTMDADSYMAAYVAVRNLPRFVRQVFSYANLMMPTLSLLILTGLFVRYRARKTWIVIALIALIGINSTQESRTPLFLLLFGAVTLYHHVVRPLSLRGAIVIGLIGLTAFVMAGYVRLGADQPFTVKNLFVSATEFETIFANAYDLYFVQSARGALIGNLPVRLSDVITPIPQQLLPFTKMTPAEWYLVNYYPEMLAAGGGNAFGVVAESITGHGWIELVLRGLAVGLLFGWLHRWASSRLLSPGMLAFYVWMTMWAYQCVRNTTLPLVGWFVYAFAFPLVVVTLGTLLITRVGGRRAPAHA